MSELIYVASIARSLENTLLGSEKITRMVFAESYEDALKILAESGFGNMSEGGVDAMIAAEELKLARFMKEVGDLKGMRSFALKNDYHNAKAFMKGAQEGLFEALTGALAAASAGVSAAVVFSFLASLVFKSHTKYN